MCFHVAPQNGVHTESGSPGLTLPLAVPRSELSSDSHEMDLRKSRISEEQTIAILKEHQAGIALAEICREHGIGEQSQFLRDALSRARNFMARFPDL